MNKPSRLTTLLYRSLWNENLFPSNPDYRNTEVTVMRAGWKEWFRLSGSLGYWKLWRGIWAIQLPNSYLGAVRLLGWGYALTNYFVAPIPIPKEEKEKIFRIGALANFIVNIYDFLADHHPNPNKHFSKDMLEQILSLEKTTLPDVTSRTEKLIYELCQEYIQELSSYNENKQHTHVIKIIKHAIQRMFQAENESIQKRQSSIVNPVNRELIIKDAYPFIIMGLAGWLTIHEIDPKFFFWHLRWLYKVGAFYGRLDDAVDLERDILAGHPNLYSDLLGLTDANDKARTMVVDQLIRDYRKIVEEWNQYASKENLQTEHIFSASLATWFGELQ